MTGHIEVLRHFDDEYGSGRTGKHLADGLKILWFQLRRPSCSSSKLHSLPGVYGQWRGNTGSLSGH